MGHDRIEEGQGRQRISGQTQVVGLIGWPVEHSVSPAMHNAAFQALELDWAYLPFQVEPCQVAAALAGARALGMRGVNVTVPHKQTVCRLVDELTPAARAIGAVNTVLFDQGRSIGHNTDASGFVRALTEIGFRIEGCQAVVIGAGGAARAVVYALNAAGATVAILNRTPAKAQALAAEVSLGGNGNVLAEGLTPHSLEERTGRADIIVNTTPLGMWPMVQTCPWPDDLPFPTHALCYDLVYNPRETRLLEIAREAGAQTANGLSMLVHQGAEAFALWTGIEPPVDVMYDACINALGGD